DACKRFIADTLDGFFADAVNILLGFLRFFTTLDGLIKGVYSIRKSSGIIKGYAFIEIAGHRCTKSNRHGKWEKRDGHLPSHVSSVVHRALPVCSQRVAISPRRVGLVLSCSMEPGESYKALSSAATREASRCAESPDSFPEMRRCILVKLISRTRSQNLAIMT